MYGCVCVGIRSANKRDSCAKSFVTHHRILFSILSRAAALQLRLRRRREQERVGESDREGRGGGSLLTVQPLGIIFERALEFVFQALCRRIIQIRAKDHSIRLREFRICARVLRVCDREKEIERQKKKGRNQVFA